MSYPGSYEDIVEDYTKVPEVEHKKFKPYTTNGGSVVAIAGEDYAIIGADTRLSVDYSIINRSQDKLFKLTDTSVLGATGCWADVITLSRLLKVRIGMYRYEHNRDMSTPALAQMVSTMLYYKRFFPYYVQNVIAGLDENGKGCVFSYDPIGHCEKSDYRAGGTAGPLLQPLLDNQLGTKNMINATPRYLKKEKAICLVKDGFTCAAERDVYTGDDVLIMIITKSGICQEEFCLRKD